MSRLSHNVKMALDDLTKARSAVYVCNRLIKGDDDGQSFKITAAIQGHFGDVFYNQTHDDLTDAAFSAVVSECRSELLAKALERLREDERIATAFLAVEVERFLKIDPASLLGEPDSL